MKVGAERKKLALLGALVVVMLLVGYYEFFAGDSDSQSPAAVAVAPVNAPPIARAKPLAAESRRTSLRIAPGDWKPRLGPKIPEDRPDPATIDPTLRLNLLAKVQGVEAGPPGRNLFVFGVAPRLRR